jgi:hypothetical protein
MFPDETIGEATRSSAKEVSVTCRAQVHTIYHAMVDLADSPTPGNAQQVINQAEELSKMALMIARQAKTVKGILEATPS